MAESRCHYQHFGPMHMGKIHDFSERKLHALLHCGYGIWTVVWCLCGIAAYSYSRHFRYWFAGFVDICWNVFIVPLDALFYALSGFHFINWSDEVINKCYRCKGKYTFADVRTVTLYKTWAEWAELLKCGNEQMVQGFMRIFTSLVPSPKWCEWANGRNQSPPNWEPKVLGY